MVSPHPDFTQRNPLGFQKRLYLVLTFCHLLRVAKLGELRACFAAAKLTNITDKDISKYLDILQICRFVARVGNGARNTYFVSLIQRIPIKAAFVEDVDSKEKDILRWINLIVADISTEDPVRLEMFREHNNVS